ncbi:MAG TPA: pyridoxal-phosphate dependent enzyme, partial [Bacillota bacterium]|nr:pyridoxal-phosphate dependent enzyme [Bacillota bacterium]
ELTIADSIAVGIPRNPVKGMDAVLKSNGAFIEVDDDEILKSMRILAEKEGIFAEPAAAASVAGYIKARRTNLIKKDESVTIIVTGNGLKDQNTAFKTIKDWVEMEPDLQALITYIENNKGEK